MANNEIKPETLEEQPASRKSMAKQLKTEAKKDGEPKRNRLKETFGELKKVTWPTFGKTMAQTGMVIGVVAIFALLVLGIDTLLAWLFKLISG